MADSETAPERDRPPSTATAVTEVRGRRISLVAYGIAKAASPAREAQHVTLDEFGLPLRRRSIAPRSSVSSTGEEIVHEDGKNDLGTDGGRLTFPRRRSTSGQRHQRSRSLSNAPGRGIEKGDVEHVEEEEIDILGSIKSHAKPTRSHRRSRSLGAANQEPAIPAARPSQQPNVQLLNDRRDATPERSASKQRSRTLTLTRIPETEPVVVAAGVSEWSHQALAPREVEVEPKKEDEWQDMPAYGRYDLYDDDGYLLARGAQDSDNEGDVYAGIGGAGKGYTRVQIDDDAKSATSMDENTSYLFKEKGTNVVDEDEDQRDPLAQMKATKDMLTEGQRIAYVGVARLAMVQMLNALEDVQSTKLIKKEMTAATESMKKWSQKMMVRLYSHMDIDSSEQIMIEQLAEHGVQPSDLTPALMQNSRVKNPMAEASSAQPSPNINSESIPSTSSPNPNASPKPDGEGRSTRASSVSADRASDVLSPPPYALHQNDELPEVRNPDMLPATKNIDIDLRWTVLCDLFLVLISDSLYDSRSRVLLEIVGAALDISWLDICRFETRVTEALEMQEAAVRENWDEADHMEDRRKKALKRKYLMMGLATVGGSLVIGLSAGLLAPVIGAGLAAGFTTIGVAGTSGFLAGAGGTALITSGAVLSGGTIAARASHRRTGAVKTFEYRPLHNNKRVNLIVTISGWMNGKVDDVRLPFSTIDPIMGDMYSVLWEPDMLTSMGDTIRILATEALTQGLQQVLASTILTALMASLTLPIVLTKLSYLIDNPWSVSLDRADAAGLILADSLMERNLGARPITLVGFSLGCRVIFTCLKELANKGGIGLIQNVYLFGSPVVARKEDFLRARTVISGRFVNGYASNDWILGYLFRATSGGISRIAGLAPVLEIPGLENVDVAKLVNGHMAYRAAMPALLREVGWEVESLEFTEIEDPDPENHEARQRELIREIEGARAEAQAKPEKKRFGFFKRGKLAEKKGWETYDEKTKGPLSSDKDDKRNSILFDIDAIRAELESENMEVRQLESTLPPMRLDLDGSRGIITQIPQSQVSTLRPTKSLDEVNVAVRPYSESNSSQINLTADHSIQPMHEDDFEPRDLDAQPTLSFDPPLLPSAVLAWQGNTITRDNGPTTAQRPGLSTSLTMPVGPSPSHLEHNAWADEDEDLGMEREVKMSFA